MYILHKESAVNVPLSLCMVSCGCARCSKQASTRCSNNIHAKQHTKTKKPYLTVYICSTLLRMIKTSCSDFSLSLACRGTWVKNKLQQWVMPPGVCKRHPQRLTKVDDQTLHVQACVTVHVGTGNSFAFTWLQIAMLSLGQLVYPPGGRKARTVFAQCFYWHCVLT